MGFSDSKAAVLKPVKEKGLLTFLLGLLVSAAFFLPYMFISEGYFTFYGDFNVQQIPFYRECHAAIKSGNIFWNWNTDLGANFIGSYSFYLLGSPFFWLTIPFPNSFVPYLMGPLLILKFGCAALTAYFYIRRFTRTPDAAMLGGLMYAFSGFSIYNIFFNHFHEPIIFFPILLLALEMLVTENRRMVFALAVCLCAVVNYFFFFGMVVFTIIYFLVRLFSGAIKVKFSRFLIVALEAVIGLLMSAFLLLPSIMAIMGNNRITDYMNGWGAIMYGKEQIYANVLQCFFFPPDIPARPIFFPGADVKWSSLGGWLPVFSMVGVFTWFSKRKNHWIKRVLGICIFMALVPVLNSAFYAFNTSYYARWFYMPILLMCLATVSLTEDSKVDWGYGFKWVAGITAAITLVIAFFPREVEEGKYTFGLFTPDNGTVYNYTLLSWIFIGLSLLFIISLIIVVSYSKKHPLSFLKTLLSVLILASLVAYGVEFYRHNNQGDYTYMIRFWITSFIAIVSLLILYILLKLLKSNRKAFYTSATACVCIISAIYGNVYVFSGRQHSYDIKEVMIDQLIEGEMGVADDSEYRIDVYDGVDNTSMYLGVPGINAFHSVVPSSIFEFYDFIGVERSVGSRPDTDVAPIRSLLSVKYLLNPKCGDSFLDEENEPKMYGFKYLKTYNDYYIYENENHIPYGFSYDYYMNYDFCEQYSENSRTGMMLKAMLLNEEQIKKYGDYMTDISELEEQWYTEEGTTLLLTEESQEYDSRKLAETSATTFERDNGGFTAIVERDRENLVFFSVPYDEGWSATVNGEEVEIEKVNAGFMAVPVPVGRSTVRFQYTTPGLGKGILISVISCSVLVLYGAICYLIRRKKGEGYTKYPEGDILIKTWKMQQLSEAREQIENYNAPVKPSLLEKAEKSEHESTETDFKGGFEINTDLFKEK